jgi:tRNA (guanine37-N1)-methyltransferase
LKSFHVFTLVPEAFDWFVGRHPVATAIEAGSARVTVHDLRTYSALPHHEVDDTPYGGGPGMVGRVDIVAAALEQVFAEPAGQVRESRDVYVMAAGGRPFVHAFGLELARSERDLVLLCGRFEGFDARVEALLATGSISVGPYVLAGGEVAALAVMRRLCVNCAAHWGMMTACLRNRSARSWGAWSSTRTTQGLERFRAARCRRSS